MVARQLGNLDARKDRSSTLLSSATSVKFHLWMAAMYEPQVLLLDACPGVELFVQ